MADAAQTHSWEGAAVFVAPLGSTMPTTVTASLDAAFLDLGFLSEDGITQGMEMQVDRYYGTHLAGSALLKTSKRNFRPYFKAVALEDNNTVHELKHTDQVPTDDGTTQTRPLAVPRSKERAIVLEVREGATVKRYLLPRCELSAIGETQHSASGIAGAELEFDVYVESDGSFGSELQAV